MIVYVITVDDAGMSTFSNEVFSCGYVALRLFERYVDEERDTLIDYYGTNDIDLTSGAHAEKYGFYYKPWDDVSGEGSFHDIDGEPSIWIRRVNIKEYPYGINNEQSVIK